MSDLKKAAAILGRIGGAAGRGAKKARTPEQCRKAAQKRWALWRMEKEKK